MALATAIPRLSPDSRNKPQALAYYSKADILLYGGKPHGGKTFLQVLLPYLEHQNSLIIRRSFQELKSGIIKDTKKFYPIETSRYYNKQDHLWSLPTGQSIQYGYGERVTDVDDNDFLQYKGPNWDYIGIDEVSQIPRFGDGVTVIDLLMSWNRTTIEGQRVRMVLTTNPGGMGEEWLIELFAPWLDESYSDPAEHGELRYVNRDEKGILQFSRKPTSEDSKSLTYIEASWEDNPYTMKGYKEGTLDLLPEPLRSQLLEAKWGISSQDDLWQVIPSDWIRQAQERWLPQPETDWDGGGIDVAYGGLDSTVLSLKKLNWFARLKKWPGKETPDGRSAAKLIIPWIKHKRFPILVDAFGFGADCYGALRGEGIAWAKCHFGNRPVVAKDKDKQLGFYNDRAEAVWRLREALNPVHGSNLELPPDRKLFSDLTTFRWEQGSKSVNGKTIAVIKIKSKTDMIKLLGRSPDDGDAVIMCNYASYKNSLNQVVELNQQLEGGVYQQDY